MTLSFSMSSLRCESAIALAISAITESCVRWVRGTTSDRKPVMHGYPTFGRGNQIKPEVGPS